MKKAFLTILLFLTCSAAAEAQGFTFGLRAGATVANLIGLEGTLPKAGLYAGPTVTYEFAPRWSIASEAVFSMQGARYKESDRNLKMWYDFNYINFPLMVTYRLKGYDCTFMFGLQCGVVVWQKVSYLCPAISGDGMVAGGEHFARGKFYPVEGGVTAGVRYRPWDLFGVELRYTYGTTQIHKGLTYTMNGYYAISVPDNRNSVFQIGLYYEF